VATGESHSVREFLERTFEKLSLDWRKYVEIDPRYFRPTEVDYLLGDASKVRERLGWKPRVGFDQLIEMMVAHDLELAKREKVLLDAGYEPQGRNACE
ncbi:MAG: GDP-mannose 4,6-dehydratase, partial [Candidatus Desulforudaceae bacterium]